MKVTIRGPDRADKQRAESDLQRMRAAGQIGKTREQGLEIMTAEAMRIKTDAKYQEGDRRRRPKSGRSRRGRRRAQ